MKIIKYFIFIMIFCASCVNDRQRLRFVCTCDQMDEVQDFIKVTIKDANNMADEEMEDVISELKRTAIQTNCSQRLIWLDNRGWFLPEKNKIDSCETIIF